MGELLACGSENPVAIAVVLAVEVPFVDVVGSGVEEAISSSRDVAASSLRTAMISQSAPMNNIANSFQDQHSNGGQGLPLY